MILTAEQQKICIKCGECCRWMTFTLNIPEAKRRQKFIEFYKVRECVVKIEEEQTVVMIPHICPHLKDDGCDIYEDRPIACREYNGRYDPHLKYKCQLPEWR